MTKRALSLAAVGAAVIALLFVGYPYLEFARFGYAVSGIDVSHHQGRIDWPRVAKSGVAFAYIKETEGGDFLDDRFTENWRGAAAAGIPRGAYHFFRQCRPGDVQAQNFIARVPKVSGALPPVVDVEDMDPCPVTNATLDPVAEITVFLDTLERHYGCRPLIYTTLQYHTAYLANLLRGERYWLRSIHVPPFYGSSGWVLWQYHHRGRRAGIAGDVDLNAFRGTKEDFETFAKGEGCQPKREKTHATFGTSFFTLMLVRR
ncbi:MAG: GH25 family lysozyme [Hyphomicrobium sp.]